MKKSLRHLIEKYSILSYSETIFVINLSFLVLTMVYNYLLTLAFIWTLFSTYNPIALIFIVFSSITAFFLNGQVQQKLKEYRELEEERAFKNETFEP